MVSALAELGVKGQAGHVGLAKCIPLDPVLDFHDSSLPGQEFELLANTLAIPEQSIALAG